MLTLERKKKNFYSHDCHATPQKCIVKLNFQLFCQWNAAPWIKSTCVETWTLEACRLPLAYTRVTKTHVYRYWFTDLTLTRIQTHVDTAADIWKGKILKIEVVSVPLDSSNNFLWSNVFPVFFSGGEVLVFKARSVVRRDKRSSLAASWSVRATSSEEKEERREERGGEKERRELRWPGCENKRASERMEAAL